MMQKQKTADLDEYTGERAPVEIQPDQARLLAESSMVEHSARDGRAEAPFD